MLRTHAEAFAYLLHVRSDIHAVYRSITLSRGKHASEDRPEQQKLIPLIFNLTGLYCSVIQ